MVPDSCSSPLSCERAQDSLGWRLVLTSSSPPYDTRPQVATVDKYQGQQNDYVLLSLVRSRVVGHLRDVRRLVVAMSRARLGLYVFGRQELFANCYELQPTFK